MNWNDIGNGLFELGGAYFTWRNYFQLRKDRELKGIWWPLIAFMTAWGFWNLIYYPSLDQWFSFAGGVVLVGGNAMWVILALKLKHLQPKKRLVWLTGDPETGTFFVPDGAEAIVGFEPGSPPRILVRFNGSATS